MLVTGEAGVGKSRLIAEFCSLLATSRWRIGQGACLQFAQRPYGPVLDVISRLDPAVGDLAPAASRHEQFNVITDTFARAARKSATVAVIEDLHWADAATIELLAYLSPKLAAMRLLIIASLRPEEVHSGHPAYAGLAKLVSGTRTERVELAALAGPELHAFIDTALEGFELADETRRAVALTGEGNPFFTEELLKSAVERRGLARTSDATALPTTVRATLLERLRPLDESEHKVLAQAAVIGRSFDLDLLARTLGTDTASLLPALQRARDFQLIKEESPTLFRFRHALTREAIYADFLTAQLRPLHHTIAVALENVPAEQRSIESLAYHWWAAGDAANSVRYNELAGDAAGAVHAHDDAIRFFQRALDTVEPVCLQRGRLFEKIADRRLAMSFHDAALSAYAQAAAIFRALGDSEREATCLVREAVQRYTGRDTHPTAALEAMLERLDHSDFVSRSRVHLGIAWLTITFYEPDETIHHLAHVDRRAIETVPEIDFRFHNVVAWLAMVMGDAERYRAEHALWLAAARRMGGTGLVASVYYNGAFCYALLGLHEDAERDIGLAIDSARAECTRHGEASAHAVSAFCRLLRGNLAGAKADLDVVRAIPTDNQITIAHAAAWGSVVAAHLDDPVLTAYWFDRLEGAASSFTAFLCGAGYAEIMVRRGRLQDARALLHEALSIGERPRGHVLTMVAVARYGATQDFPRARTILQRAADAPTELVERYALSLFDALVAERERRTDAAIALAQHAAAGLRRLGFPLLEAAALELAGEPAAALEIYRHCGATYDVGRLEPEPAKTLDSSNGMRTPASERDRLSKRERAIAALVTRGQSNLQIGRTLSISHKTVEKHLGAVYRKLGISSRAELSAYAALTEAGAANGSGAES